MTVAPNERATSEVRSVEPLSTTITSSTKAGMRLSTRSIPCSSFKQGMITVSLNFLYMLYDGFVKRSAALLLCSIVCGAPWLTIAAGLENVHSVYVLPMTGGLDQYLANRLS